MINLKLSFITLFLFSSYSIGQNLFPVKLKRCNTESFCLDCGEVKGGYKKATFDRMIAAVESKLDLNDLMGAIYFQVLIDAEGSGCVLSHTDQYDTYVSELLVKYMNKFTGWTPAVTDGKNEDMTSINILVRIEDAKLHAQVERVDMKAFTRSISSTPPQIFNEHYTYDNPNLDKYSFSVWHSENSELTNDFNDDIDIDSAGNIWYTLHRGVGLKTNEQFTEIKQNIHPNDNETLRYNSLCVDNSNTIWLSCSQGIYTYNGKWTFLDSNEVGVDGAYRIVNNMNTGEVFICSEQGLAIYKAGTWSKISKATHPELPSNRVYFAKRDSRERLWIGTFEGSLMIDTNGQVWDFNQGPKTPLRGRCIDAMCEDPSGNLYMGTYLYGPEGKGKANKDDGLVTYSIDGEWQRYTTDNSGMPFNNITNLVYDSIENLLWLGTDRAGLVRFDLKDGWENYHSENTEIPSSYITDLTIGEDGSIWLSTRKGIVNIRKK